MRGKFCPGEHSQLPFPPENEGIQTGVLLKEAGHKIGWFAMKSTFLWNFHQQQQWGGSLNTEQLMLSPADTGHTDVIAVTHRTEPGAKPQSHQLTLNSCRAQAQ